MRRALALTLSMAAVSLAASSASAAQIPSKATRVAASLKPVFQKSISKTGHVNLPAATFTVGKVQCVQTQAKAFKCVAYYRVTLDQIPKRFESVITVDVGPHSWFWQATKGVEIG